MGWERGPSLAERTTGTALPLDCIAADARPDGAVAYQNPRSEGPSDGVPVTLTVEQIGGERVRRGGRAVAVFAWVP